MENSITFNPKYKIGDTVYAVLWESEVTKDFWDYDDDKLQVYPKKIVAVRYVQRDEISSIGYFLEGMDSFFHERENWFDENPVGDYVAKGIFETKEEANEHLRKFNEWYHLDDENNNESND